MKKARSKNIRGAESLSRKRGDVLKQWRRGLGVGDLVGLTMEVAEAARMFAHWNYELVAYNGAWSVRPEGRIGPATNHNLPTAAFIPPKDVRDRKAKITADLKYSPVGNEHHPSVYWDFRKYMNAATPKTSDQEQILKVRWTEWCKQAAKVRSKNRSRSTRGRAAGAADGRVKRAIKAGTIEKVGRGLYQSKPRRGRRGSSVKADRRERSSSSETVECGKSGSGIAYAYSTRSLMDGKWNPAGVNWSCCGSVAPEFAEEFAGRLRAAIAEARRMDKRHGIANPHPGAAK